MRHALLILGILCVVISIAGLSRPKPKVPRVLGPCGFDELVFAKGTCKADISCWSVENGKWKDQPILVINGQRFTYPSPGGYLDDMRTLRAQPYCLYNPDGKWGKWVLMVDLDAWDDKIRKMEQTALEF